MKWIIGIVMMLSGPAYADDGLKLDRGLLGSLSDNTISEAMKRDREAYEKYIKQRDAQKAVVTDPLRVPAPAIEIHHPLTISDGRERYEREKEALEAWFRASRVQFWFDFQNTMMSLSVREPDKYTAPDIEKPLRELREKTQQYADVTATLCQMNNERPNCRVNFQIEKGQSISPWVDFPVPPSSSDDEPRCGPNTVVGTECRVD